MASEAANAVRASLVTGLVVMAAKFVLDRRAAVLDSLARFFHIDLHRENRIA